MGSREIGCRRRVAGKTSMGCGRRALLHWARAGVQSGERVHRTRSTTVFSASQTPLRRPSSRLSPSVVECATPAPLPQAAHGRDSVATRVYTQRCTASVARHTTRYALRSKVLAFSAKWPVHVHLCVCTSQAALIHALGIPRAEPRRTMRDACARFSLDPRSGAGAGRTGGQRAHATQGGLLERAGAGARGGVVRGAACMGGVALRPGARGRRGGPSSRWRPIASPRPRRTTRRRSGERQRGVHRGAWGVDVREPQVWRAGKRYLIWHESKRGFER